MNLNVDQRSPDKGAARIDFGALVEAAARRSRRRRLKILTAQMGAAVLLVAAWQVTAEFWMDPFWISSPDRVANQIVELAVSGDLWRHTLATLKAAGLGFLLGASAGLVTGFVLGRIEALRRIFQPFVMAGYVVPKVALAPLFILWFGLGMPSKIALTALITYFLIFLAILEGVRSVDPDYVALVKFYGASRRQVFQSVILPATAPWLLSGVRISLPFALTGAIVAEFVAASEGLGYYMRQSAAFVNTAGIFAGVIVLAVLGLSANALLEKAHKVLLPWRESEAKGLGVPP